MKKRLLISTLLLLSLVPLVAADSYELWCMERGEQFDFGATCNPAMDIVRGPTQVCVHFQDNEAICPTKLSNCYSRDLACSATGDHTTIDETPPQITLTSPEQNQVYTSRSILLGITSNERVSLQYKDNSESRVSWKNICSDCTSYSRERSFNEGLNDLTIKAQDRAGNTAFLDVTFRVDSKYPRLNSVETTDEFSSGYFKVEFDEDNPVSLVLNYGNPTTGMRSYNFDIETECTQDRRYTCETLLDLSDYDGESIQFSATIIDIAGNSDTSSMERSEVDYTPPAINSLTERVDGKHVTFVLDVTELNFEEAEYLDNSDPRQRWKRLCSRLEGTTCEKRVSFNDGNHDVTVRVTDKAGQSTETSISFFTDSKAPKIKNIEPSRDFASGEFYIEFDEQNPVSLVLNYGNSQTGFREHILDIAADCTFGRYSECDTFVNLNDYDGEEIEYTFTLTDLAGQTAEDGEDDLLVDLTLPVINSITHEIIRNQAEVVLDITELNLDEVTYINSADSRPRERRFCSRLDDDGTCGKKISLEDGLNEITFTVYDEAGNSVSENYDITL